MRNLRWREMTIIGMLLIVLGISLLPSLAYARRERRDGMRRLELAELKHQLEIYNNEHKMYPLQFQTGPHQYVVTDSDDEQALGWYVRAKLENDRVPEAGFDNEGGRTYSFRIIRQRDITWYDICGGNFECEE